jgi:hypothetical protein
MKLTYRGIAYEVSAPVRSGVAHQVKDQPKTKLIYRGHTYYATPCAAVEAVELTGPTVPLHYRGSTYKRQLPAAIPYYGPRAINWRYRAAH